MSGWEARYIDGGFRLGGAAVDVELFDQMPGWLDL